MSTAARPTRLITRQGHERLAAELDELVRVRRPQLSDALRAARAEGGEPEENTTLIQALQDQEAVDRRIDELRALLASAEIAEPPADGTVGLGQAVRIRLGAGAEPAAYLLVGALEADATRGEISIESPIGQALVGRRAGDVVEVRTPGGLRRIEVVSVG